MKTIVIIADAPNIQLEPLPEEFDALIALDGATKHLNNSSIIPDYILGDLDTINSETIEYYKNKNTEIIKIPDQNSTDLDKGIVFAQKLGATTIIIINALYGRMDHTLYNTRVLKKYYDPLLHIELWNNNEKLLYLENQKVILKGNIDSNVALLSFPSCIISSSGLKYDMLEYKLEIGKSESTCNSLKNASAHIEVRGFALIIIDKQTQIHII